MSSKVSKQSPPEPQEKNQAQQASPYQKGIVKKGRGKPNSMALLVVFIIGMSLSMLSQRMICQNWPSLSDKIFETHTLADSLDKLTILRQSLLLTAVLEFIIAFSIMNIRIFGLHHSPVAQKDTLSIALLNRILTNNIEQAFVFFGLYSYLLLSSSQDIQVQYVFSLPLLFLIGRVLYGLSYIIATVVNISTVRSFGFAFSISVNYFMLFELILGHTSLYRNLMFA